MADDRILVTLFLRGGLDGLNAVVPTFEDDYHRRRPTLALETRRAGTTESGAIPLDGRFALNPGLEPLLPAFREGRLAIVHAVGSDDDTRSHFEAQDQMEHGASVHAPLAGGWAARWLRTLPSPGALSALAFGKAVPETLRGAPSVTAVTSLDEIRLSTARGDDLGFAEALESLYAGAGPDSSNTRLLRRSARDALALLRRVADIRTEADGAGDYPRTDLGRALAQVARLIRREVGLRVAAVDQGGYDTHFGQALLLEDNLRELSEALAAFERDLGPLGDRVTVLCLTEFGRRAYENTSLGTDHGRASCAFVLGGGVRGGNVLGRWPGLGDGAVEGPGDLAVTTDYRDLIWEVLERRFGASESGRVFPGHRPRPVGVMT